MLLQRQTAPSSAGRFRYAIVVLPIDMPTAENVANRAGLSDSLMRERLIDTARDGWMNRLIDLSRRNNLLFYKPVASGTLELPISNSIPDEAVRVSESGGKRVHVAPVEEEPGMVCEQEEDVEPRVVTTGPP